MSHSPDLKEVIVVEEGRVVLQFALLSFFCFILPLLLQFSYTLKQTRETITASHSMNTSSTASVAAVALTCNCLSIALIFLKVSAMILQSRLCSSLCISLYWKFTSDCSASTRPKCFMTHDTITSSITSGRITSLSHNKEGIIQGYHFSKQQPNEWSLQAVRRMLSSSRFLKKRKRKEILGSSNPET